METSTIIYDSRTGNVQRFVDKLKKISKFNILKVNEDLVLENPYHLVTYTTGIGEIPRRTKLFLLKEKNYEKMLSVSSSGNKNWGKMFAKTADTISQKFKIPICLKFELSGTDEEVKLFKNKILKNGRKKMG